MRTDVVALFVDERGPYPKLVSECYDQARDATTYAGTLPVVAHPPCGPWSRLKHLNKYQKREHALHALETVRRVGGVLEHPHGSQLWKHAGLPKVGEPADEFGGRTIEVEQVRWGHVAMKRTWLYIVGAPEIPEIPPMREPTHWCDGTQAKVHRMKLCSAQQRRRTPVAFAEWLLELAARCKR